MTTTNGAAWTAHAGAAFLAPSGPSKFNHLYVVLNDPIQFPNRGSQPCVCIVNFSSVPTNPNVPYDKTCIFPASAAVHTFLQADSYVYYGRAREEFAKDIETMVAKGIYSPKPPNFGSVIVQQILVGLRKSNSTPKNIVALPI
ncbi:hypothetical protein AWB69_00010 [Caballeronia udeis]|uniref:Uncharacterized protein n=1 Tax=Caballeronia udeis TaxID=1232866 RepID=A0A158ERH9_9BURK|nr:hypothetical protein [Caballeronia udeis]SAL09270.1 hypothetical protein AWB69_00010 [Caballeronia udeis]